MYIRYIYVCILSLQGSFVERDTRPCVRKRFYIESELYFYVKNVSDSFVELDFYYNFQQKIFLRIFSIVVSSYFFQYFFM